MFRIRRKAVLTDKLDENMKNVEKLSDEITLRLDKIGDLEIDLILYERGS